MPAVTMGGARPHDAGHLPKVVKSHPHGMGAVRWSEHSIAWIRGGCARDFGPRRTGVGEQVSCARLRAPKQDATDQCARLATRPRQSHAMRPVNVYQEAGEFYAWTRPNPPRWGQTLLPDGRRANPAAWDPNNTVPWGHTLLPRSRRANPTAWDPNNPVPWGQTLLPHG